MPEELENQTTSTESEGKDRTGVDAEFPEHPSESPELAETVRALTDERDALKDQLLRKQAEFENFRKRIDRERAEFVQFASAELMREVLNVLDSFEPALRNVAGDDNDGKTGQGFDLIYKQLLDILKRFGLELIEARGRRFDPHVHEAVSTQPSGDAEEGTVLEELRAGYLLNGKLLRPSMVIVSEAAPGDTVGPADA